MDVSGSTDSERPLAGRVALVAGATRGAGRAIAIELGAAGATVYATGRSTRGNPSPMARAETLAQAEELRPHGIAAVAVSPGFLRSEPMLDHFGVTEATWRDAIATLAERERVAADARIKAQRQDVIAERGELHERVQALAANRDDAVVDVGAGELRRDRLAVEEDPDCAAGCPRTTARGRPPSRRRAR